MKTSTLTALVVSSLLGIGTEAVLAADACELVTQADAEAVFGQSVKRGKRSAPSCAWDTGSPIGGMTIDVVDAAPIRMLKGSHPTVEGLGDDAFFQLKMKVSVVMHAIKGDQAVTISVSFPLGKPAKVTDLEEAAKELAKIALGKL